MTKTILIIFVLLLTSTCTHIYNKPEDNPRCQKFEDQGYQKVLILTNYWELSPDDFMAYVIKEAKPYEWTKIRVRWKKVLGGKWIVREAYVYYERKNDLD